MENTGTKLIKFSQKGQNVKQINKISIQIRRLDAYFNTEMSNYVQNIKIFRLDP